MHFSYLYRSAKRPNNPTGLTTPCFQGRLYLKDSKIHFNNTLVGTTDSTYNIGFTSRLYMANYINDIPNQRNASEVGNKNNKHNRTKDNTNIYPGKPS